MSDPKAKDWYDYKPPSSDDDLPSTTPVYAILHFDLEEPEGERRLRECLDAPNVKSALRELDQWLRGQIKHTDREDVDTLQEARDRLWVALGDHGVNLDDD